MPVFLSTQVLSVAPHQAFAFFACPANVLRITPPELRLQIVEGPEQLAHGARLTYRGKRWGLPQRVVSEITVWTPPDLMVEEQREGPFRRWVHLKRFEAVVEGTLLTDEITFEPPGGLLGLTATAAFVEKDLHWLFEYRRAQLGEVFRSGAEQS